MKRHNFAGGPPRTASRCRTASPGSIGQRQTPGRVFPGKRMSGHMGVVRRTTENLKVIEVDVERNLLLIRGAVPGAEGGQVLVRRRSRRRAWPSARPWRRLKVGSGAVEGPGQGGKEVSHETEARQRLRRAAGLRRHLRPQVQRGAGAPGGDRVSQRRPRRHQGAEVARRSARRRPQAARPEGHRPGARRFHPPPIWVGGGRTFAAKPRDFAQKVNRKMYRGAHALDALASWRAPIACWSPTASRSRRRRPGCWRTSSRHWSLANVLIVVEAPDEKLLPRRAQPAARRGHEVAALNPVAWPPTTRC